MKESTVLRELRELTKLCYDLMAKVTVVIDKVNTLEKDRANGTGALKVWHVCTLTAVYALASSMPMEKLIDFLRLFQGT